MQAAASVRILAIAAAIVEIVAVAEDVLVAAVVVVVAAAVDAAAVAEGATAAVVRRRGATLELLFHGLNGFSRIRMNKGPQKYSAVLFSF